MGKITKIIAYEIIDSRGYPAIESRLTLDNGIEVVTSVPSGSTVGKYEALELRDNDPARFDNMGVRKAVSYINELLSPKLIGIQPTKQVEIDYWLIKADGTKNKSRLGANTTLAISQLLTKAAAADNHIPLFRYINTLYKSIFAKDIVIDRIPSPIFSIINGGKHANNNLDFQEFQIVPSSSFNFAKAYQIGVEVYHELKRVLEYRNASVSVGEEGGFTPNFSTNLDALEVLNEALNQRNLKPGLDVFFGLDIAANHFYKDDRYIVKDKPHPLKREEYIEYLLHLLSVYSVLAIEDPLQDDDWDGWKKMSESTPEQTYLVGGNLLATNKERLSRAIKESSCSSILIKPSQIGTVTETLELINLARQNKFSYIISQRSGETNDTFVADLAVGLQADFVRFGAPSRGERVAKYNRLWQIESLEMI
ncbi:phosphopyruvate hydratase [Candidatus Roizmanbacteria bacterium]|nr:phosphopyruvate hydratase [Candidatus Roizmanbacteria bacterium]